MAVGPNGRPGQSVKACVAREFRNGAECVIARHHSMVAGLVRDRQYKNKTVLHLVRVSLITFQYFFDNVVSKRKQNATVIFFSLATSLHFVAYIFHQCKKYKV